MLRDVAFLRVKREPGKGEAFQGRDLGGRARETRRKPKRARASDPA